MYQRPVIILGAGATKACGGPLTDEILPAALKNKLVIGGEEFGITDREDLLFLTRDFMLKCFNIPTDDEFITKETCPSLPMVLSMLRRSTQLKQPIGEFDGEDLIKARRAVEYSVFAVIEAALKRIPYNKRFHNQLLQPLYQNGLEPTVISLNYDVIVDNAMFVLSENFQNMRPPEYGVDIATRQYKNFSQAGTFGHLLKIHGSLNWLYCDKCKRLDLHISESMRTAKALDELYHTVPLNDAYSCQGTPCRNYPQCDGFVNPILITPTYVKDYENPHVEKVWQNAEAKLKEADKVVFIGYSLPSDDVEVAMLLKRGLDHLSRDKITVVEFVAGDENKPVEQRTPLSHHPTGQRFRSLFGPDIDWQTTGFQGWLNELSKNGESPFS